MNAAHYRFFLTGWLVIAGCLCLKLDAAEAIVSVQLQGQTYHYQQQPRLAEVLQPVAFNQDWYWPAARLYRVNTKQLEQLRNQLLQQLAELKGKWRQDSAYVNTIEQLSFQLQQWQLAERIAINIDYDLARLKQAANPLFEPGQYLLTLMDRPSHILVFGLARAERITHYGNSSTSVYSDQLRRLAGASQDWLYILQPDGEVIKAGTASWNQQHIELMPGAQLFVPFDPGFFGNEFSAINQLVLELARHRVMQ